MVEGTNYECPHPSLGACRTPTPYVVPPCVLGTWGGGGVGAHWGPPLLSSMTSERIQRSEKGTPVAIFGSLGVCIYGPASRHWLISYSSFHLT